MKGTKEEILTEIEKGNLKEEKEEEYRDLKLKIIQIDYGRLFNLQIIFLALGFFVGVLGGVYTLVYSEPLHLIGFFVGLIFFGLSYKIDKIIDKKLSEKYVYFREYQEKLK
jgi:hypothetical protein